MRSDVHSAALRAAAKVAFSVAFLSGCGGAVGSAVGEGEDPVTGEGSDPRASDSDLTANKNKAKKPKVVVPSSTSCHGSTPTPPASCEAVVDAAFPTEGDYPGVKQLVSQEVKTCCVDLLEKSNGMLDSHRWDCCANVGPNPSQSVAMACTPWGPPVPPAMKRRAKPALPDAWIALAEVA